MFVPYPALRGPAADPEGLRPAVRPRGPAAAPGQRGRPGTRGPSDAAFVLPEVLFIAGHLAGMLHDQRDHNELGTGDEHVEQYVARDPATTAARRSVPHIQLQPTSH